MNHPDWAVTTFCYPNWIVPKRDVTQREILERLYAYEHTGLTPKEIEELKAASRYMEDDLK